MQINFVYTIHTQTDRSSFFNDESQIAVQIQYLPQDIDWNDSTPQCSADSLTIDHFTLISSTGDPVHSSLPGDRVQCIWSSEEVSVRTPPGQSGH